MMKPTACGLASVVIAVTACTRPLAHPCDRDVECAVGWSCQEGLCQSARPFDGGSDAIDASNDGARRDLRQEEPGQDVPGSRDAGSGPNYMFVTSMMYSSGFRSLLAADGNCNSLAASAGLPGSYRAWLSTTTVRAIDRLAGARGWIRPDGAPFADTVDDLAAGRILNPAIVDERRNYVFTVPIQDVIAEPRVMTGTAPTGGPTDGSTCADWTAVNGTGSGGAVDSTTANWTSGFIFNCNERVHMFCFGTDHAEPLAPALVEGKLAFVTDELFVPVGGIEAADALCASEAAAGGLAGQFRALLTTAAATSASRIPQFDQTTWIRVDGIPLNTPGGGLDLETRTTPLNVTSRKTYLADVSVFLGAEPHSATTNTCDDWRSSTAGSVSGQIANSVRVAYGITLDCGDQAHIYCFEE